MAAAHAVIFVGERRTEEGHDPVAQHLIHRALVAVDGLHHLLEHRIEQLAGVLGVAVCEQLHRAFQIGKQHGDLLALALERGFRQEDSFGEVLGGVAPWRLELLRSCGGLADGMRALGTEFRRGRDERAAASTGALEGRGTFLAEPPAWGGFRVDSGSTS
jgi:hypothetical protein